MGLCPAALIALLVAACASGGGNLPDLTGDAVNIMVLAGLDDQGGQGGPVMIDSISFGRLGTLLEGEPIASAALAARTDRDATPVDPDDVLECPSRRPCLLRSGGTYITIWNAALTEDVLTATLSRVRNVERLYVMTEHRTWQVELRRTGTGWRLTSREPI